eukprot:6179490-Pleurochrysis_carterae.AAC.1
MSNMPLRARRKCICTLTAPAALEPLLDTATLCSSTAGTIALAITQIIQQQRNVLSKLKRRRTRAQSSPNSLVGAV